MKYGLFKLPLFIMLTSIVLLPCTTCYSENIDPLNNNSRYAYGENTGWFNFKYAFEPGVTVTDSSVTGYAWGENIGWINLYPSEYGGVINDSHGNLGGYAWGENVGWINFNPTYGGVSIDAKGDFQGWAWGENIGWIHFKNESPIAYKVQTDWTPPTLVELVSFTATPSDRKVILSWTTASEIDNAGFNLYRAESQEEEYVKINPSLIPAEGSPTQDASYQFIDKGVQNRNTYLYKLEDIDLNGTSTMHGPVSAMPRSIRCQSLTNDFGMK